MKNVVMLLVNIGMGSAGEQAAPRLQSRKSSLDGLFTKHCFDDSGTARISVMNRQVLRILFFFWLGWYLSGPLFEMVDRWDTPQEEMSDVVWSASGAVSLVAAGMCIGILVFRKFRELCCYLASSGTSAQSVGLVRFEFPSVFPVIVSAPSLDISSSLRI